ncbi:glycosyltransferase [Brevibacterium sp. CS2]|uniref:glycosyltransferase n=1 Tax=Brevibacterium sp. CS2 TaxID=2575923 RepID=UPI0010C79349|nr:glycosyltransferase [Brevibacterium sp. CS2]QCP04449.1 UDP-N-acetylglucosamine--N-acetylmuramyl-(pentapeptide) pyrophosphoryl-undecaprenol N-acetylglucosamine transferase [Brevibacterium sp. CS2]
MIGFYAHHHGTGHLTRCREIAAAVDDDTTILSSAPGADLVLPMDAPAPGVTGAALDAHGAFHWTPAHHAGLAERMAQIAAWVAEHRPRAFHVDVSVEVAVLVRAMGVPVTVQAMPGVRDDAPHAVGYRAADAIIAAWPDRVELPEHLEPVTERVHAVGGISRFAGRVPAPAGDRERTGVVIVHGGGGTDQPAAYWDAVAESLPVPVTVIGPGAWVDDPFALLSAAEVVVTAAGQNSIADLAVLGARAVVVPQDRPFGEQEATARVVCEAGLAVVPESVPAVEEWAGLIERARELEPRWEQWGSTGAAQRAARIIEEVGR